jgi:hypothetical protein
VVFRVAAVVRLQQFSDEEDAVGFRGGEDGGFFLTGHIQIRKNQMIFIKKFK